MEEDVFARLLAKNTLNRDELTRLRDAFPQQKIESLILQLSRSKGNRKLLRSLHKLQNKLYPKKRRKKFRPVATVDGKVVQGFVQGGLPSLGKRR